MNGSTEPIAQLFFNRCLCPPKKSHVSGTMASGSSSLPWDFFSSRLLDLSPGSFRPHLSGSLALPTMTMTGTVGPVGAVPTSRCSTGLPQSRGTSKGSRDLESPWPWPAVSAVGPGLRCQIQKFQAFIAVPVFSQSPFLKNMAIGWSHVSRFQLRRWWSQRFHRLFGKNVWWMLDHWLMAEGC